jgi:hypothetical protein
MTTPSSYETLDKNDSPPSTANSITDVEMQKIAIQEEAVPESKESDPNILDWNGPDDPEKPVNWTGRRKWINGGLLAAMTFVT